MKYLHHVKENRGSQILITFYLSDKEKVDNNLYSEEVKVIGSLMIPSSLDDEFTDGIKRFAERYAEVYASRSPLKISS